MEHRLNERFADAEGASAYRQFAALAPALSGFPAASDLISFLHTNQSQGNGRPSKDHVLAELVRGAAGNGRSATSRELLLWAFVPMLHRVSRQVLTRSLGLAPDDVAQHLVTAFLESLGSSEFAGRNSHFAFALARLLRRNIFAWAERESRSALYCLQETGAAEQVSDSGGAQPVERAALLRHFLDRCRRRGVISAEDVELLTQFKLEEFPDAEYSNASRQRMKRLLAKLRRAARRPRRGSADARQLRLF